MIQHLKFIMYSYLCFFMVSAFVFFPLHAQAHWYDRSVIIHACGQYKGHKYTNCKEALINALNSSYKKKTIEVDFAFTKDDVLVCAHRFDSFNERVKHIKSDEAPTLKEFQEGGTEGGGTAMKASEAISILSEYPDVYMVVDTKESGVKVYKRLVKICKRLNKKDFLDRMVIQVYDENGYDDISKVYKFKHWCLSGYKFGCSDTEALKTLLTYSKLKDFEALVIPAQSLSYDVFDDKLHNYKLNPEKLEAIAYGKEIPVLCHTVNDYEIYKSLLKHGITNVYTDFY